MNTTASSRHRRNTSPFLADRHIRRFRFRRHSPAFTIVELLIVVVIIAILATITIVAYNGIQNRARASAASSALSQAVKKLELYKVDNSAYPTSANLASAGITNTNDTTYQYTSDGTTYCLTATNVTISYYLNSTTTPSPTAGGCPGHGVGGNSPVTNLVTNPSFANDTSSWSTNAASISRVTTPWAIDSGALQVTPNGQDSYAYTDVPAEGGATYTALGTVHLESAQTGTFQGSSQQRNLFMQFRASDGTYLGAGNGIAAASPNSPGTYSQRAVGVAPAGSAILRLRLYNGATTGGGSVYWDQIMVIKGNYGGAYGDGSSLNWVWNGTANASTSTGPAL